MIQVPSSLEKRVEIVSGSVQQILKTIHQQDFKNLYTDGGKTIQRFLKEGLIHEIVLPQVPIVLDRGIPLFQGVPKTKLVHKATETFDNGMVQIHYQVKID